MTPDDAVNQWRALGREGLTVSIVYGPCGPGAACRWSVDVINRDGHAFDQPYAADSFEMAITIAVREVFDRGWLRQEVS